MKYYIYTLSDPVSKEIKYIGKTKNLDDRLSRHMQPSNLKRLWTPKNKWLKYLKNNNLRPIMELLDEGDKNNIDDLEIYWITQLKQWGYKLKNSTIGGQNPTPKGAKLKKKHIKNLSKNHPNKIPVCQYTLNNVFVKEYESAAEAERQTKLNHIGCCCRGKRKRTGDYYFRYKDNYFLYIEREDYWTGKKHKKDSKEKMKMNHPFRKVVFQYDIKTDKILNVYLSMHEAEEKTGIKRKHISICCKDLKANKSVDGYYFRFKNNYFPYKKANNYPITIYQYDKKRNLINTFKSYRQAKLSGYTIDSIKKVINTNEPYGDYLWRNLKHI